MHPTLLSLLLGRSSWSCFAFDNPVFSPESKLDAISGGVDTRLNLRIFFVEVFKQGGTFLSINLFRVGPWQARIEHIFDGEFELGAGSRFLAPVEHQEL